MNRDYILDYLYNAVITAHSKNNCHLDIEFCCGLLSLLYDSNNKKLILKLFNKILLENWNVNQQNDTPDSILNYWCARTDESLMFTVAREIYDYVE